MKYEGKELEIYQEGVEDGFQKGLHQGIRATFDLELAKQQKECGELTKEAAEAIAERAYRKAAIATIRKFQQMMRGPAWKVGDTMLRYVNYLAKTYKLKEGETDEIHNRR
jgi:hypothetical protein